MTRLELLLCKVGVLVAGTPGPEAGEMLEEIKRVLRTESRITTGFLSRLQVLKTLESIENGQDFVVVFMKKDEKSREMQCILDREQASMASNREQHKDTFTVWDKEKGAPRSFRLDFVYSIHVESLPTEP